MSYLKEKTTLEGVLGRYDFASCDSDFSADWERLLAKKQSGDELWFFQPPDQRPIRGASRFSGRVCGCRSAQQTMVAMLEVTKRLSGLKRLIG